MSCIFYLTVSLIPVHSFNEQLAVASGSRAVAVMDAPKMGQTSAPFFAFLNIHVGITQFYVCLSYKPAELI